MRARNGIPDPIPSQGRNVVLHWSPPLRSPADGDALRSFYDRDAPKRTHAPIAGWKAAERELFCSSLREAMHGAAQEGRRFRVVELGSGPGRDAAYLEQAVGCQARKLTPTPDIA